MAETNNTTAGNNAAGAVADALVRVRAAIATIENLGLNVRTIRRGTFPPEAKRRMSEILRLSTETAEILYRHASVLQWSAAQADSADPARASG